MDLICSLEAFASYIPANVCLFILLHSLLQLGLQQRTSILFSILFVRAACICVFVIFSLSSLLFGALLLGGDKISTLFHKN